MDNGKVAYIVAEEPGHGFRFVGEGDLSTAELLPILVDGEFYVPTTQDLLTSWVEVYDDTDDKNPINPVKGKTADELSRYAAIGLYRRPARFDSGKNG